MSLGRFLIGVVLSMVTMGSLASTAVVLRRRLVPLRRGPDALLVDIVLTLAELTLLSEVLGTFGALRLRYLVPTCLAIGAVGWWVRLREGGISVATDVPPRASLDTGPSSTPLGGWRIAFAGLALWVFFGSWASRTVKALTHGIHTVDSLWYHLPFAIRFFQTGRTTSIQLIDSDSVTAYFPATSSLFHAIGFMFFRIDIASAVMNMGWLALALLAAWCLGRPFGLAPVTAVGAAILLGGPGMVETQPGGALTDIVGTALLLAAAAVALAPRANSELGSDIIAAMAAGLATGAKYTFLPAAGALCIGLAATAPTGRRLRHAAAVVAASAATGGYWYVRNLLLVSNPLPTLSLGLGPLKLNHVPGTLPSSTVVSLVRDGDAWSTYLLPGLRDALGPGWPVVLLLAVSGAVLAVVRGHEPRVRLLGVVALVSFVAYLLTPQYLLGGYFFATNLRYAAPGLVLGLILFPVATREFRRWTLPGMTCVLLVTQLDPVSWPVGFGGPSFFESIDRTSAARGAIVTLAFGTALATGVMIWRRLPPTWPRAGLSAVVVPLTLLISLAAVHGRYLEGRYRGPDGFPHIYAHVRNLHHANIGVEGQYVYLKSPFAGPDLSNRVQYLGVDIGGGAWRPPRTCEDWIALLQQGGYDHIIVYGPTPAVGPTVWTAAQPDARLVARDTFPGSEARMYQLNPWAERSCPGQPG